MKWLLTSDLHLTDKPRDTYRFGLFKWLLRKQEKHNVSATFILGDLTDSKDKHSAALVNRMVNEMLWLRPPVFILKGNHDFIDPKNPFFGFLDYIEGIHFIKEPTFLAEQNVAMIPHQPSQEVFDEACRRTIRPGCTVMLHQLLDGAIGESGSRLTGIRASLAEELGAVAAWAGDVHKPQRCGFVGYLGAPYHVRFGDNFEPRVLLLDDSKQTDLIYPCPRKYTIQINDPRDLNSTPELMEGDHVKLNVSITRDEVVEWPTLKKEILDACRDRQLLVCGVNLSVDGASNHSHRETGKSKSNLDTYNDYCKHEKVSSTIKSAGKEILGV